MSDGTLDQNEQDVSSPRPTSVHLGITVDAWKFARLSLVILLALSILLLMVVAEFIAAPDHDAYPRSLTMCLGATGTALVFISCLIPQIYLRARRGFVALGLLYVAAFLVIGLVMAIRTFASTGATP